MMLALLLAKPTVTPTEGAGAVRVTVQLDVPGAFTVAGEQLKLAGCKFTVKPIVEVWLTPLRDAVTVTFCAVETVPAVAEKVAVLWLAARLTLAGKVKDVLLLLKDTVVALAAAWFNDTVQVLEALLPRVDGAHDTEVRCAGALAVRVNAWANPFRAAVSNAL